MTFLHSVPALVFLLAALSLALLARFGIHARYTGFFGVICASLLTVTVLLEGGTLYEALTYLLLTVCLVPGERSRTP